MAVKMSNRCGQPAGKASNRDRFSKEIGWYLSGFADGEGSFNVTVMKRNDYRIGWKVGLSFNISQKDDTLPLLFRKILNCGSIRYRKDGICYFEVRRVQDISKKVLPFFRKFPILSKEKRKKIRIFSQIVKIIENGKHLDRNGLKKILELREKIKVARKRKYSKTEICKRI